MLLLLGVAFVLLATPVSVQISPEPEQQSLEGRGYDSLITEMLSTNVDTTERTAQIVKAVCAAAVGGAVMLVQ